jgi:hypothetical protein
MRNDWVEMPYHVVSRLARFREQFWYEDMSVDLDAEDRRAILLDYQYSYRCPVDWLTPSY